MSGPRFRPDLDPTTRARVEYGWHRFNAERAARYEPPLTLSQYIALMLGQVLPAPPTPAPGPVSTHQPMAYAVGFGGEK